MHDLVSFVGVIYLWYLPSYCRCLFVHSGYLFTYPPLPKKSMGMIWQNMGHIWPISGNGMGRLGEDMEQIWGSILPHFNVWKIYGKKCWWYPLYGKAMGTQFPYISHSSNIFACSTSSMGMIRDVHCSIFHIIWYQFFKSHRLPIWIFYKFNLWVHKSSKQNWLP